MWSQSPEPKFPPSNEGDTWLTIPENDIPKQRRGKYARCPYCRNKELCHFQSSSCAYSKSTQTRCFPLAGLHCCNGKFIYVLTLLTLLT